MAKRRIAVIVGSLRKESFSRKLALNMIAMQPENLALEIVEIGGLPLYNQDLDETPPKEWTDFRERVRSSEGVIFVTPEYNRSIPGVLKNAIDVGSRPYGRSAWDVKPTAVVSNSPGALGGFGANHHLRQCLVFLNMPVLQQPEAYIGGIAKALGPNGELANDSTREFVGKILAAYSQWVETLASSR